MVTGSKLELSVYVANNERMIAIIKIYRLCRNVPVTITMAGTIIDRYHHKLYRVPIIDSIYSPTLIRAILE